MAASSPSTVSHGFGVFSSRGGNSEFRGRVMTLVMAGINLVVGVARMAMVEVVVLDCV